MMIYIYDNEPGCTGFKRIMAYLDGMRFMALTESEYPWGRIMGYGRTPEKAKQAAIKKLYKERDANRPKRELVSTEEVEL